MKRKRALRVKKNRHAGSPQNDRFQSNRRKYECTRCCGATEAKEFLRLAKTKKLYGVNPKKMFNAGMILSPQSMQISSFVCIDVRNWGGIIRFNLIVSNYEKQANEIA
jgi:hypothetical protein